MDDLVIIITRINTGSEDIYDEWISPIWKMEKNHLFAEITTDYKLKYVTRDTDIDGTAKAIILHGKLIKGASDFYKTVLNKYKFEEKNVLMAIHPGFNPTVPKEDLRNIFGSGKFIERPFTYTLGVPPKTDHPIVAFANTLLGEDTGAKSNAFDKLKSWIKKKPTPNLIALSILCQGYLAAHGESEFVPKEFEIEKEKKERTEKAEWWKPVLGESALPYIQSELKEIETRVKAKGELETIIGKLGNDLHDIEKLLKVEGVKRIHEMIKEIIDQ